MHCNVRSRAGSFTCPTQGGYDGSHRAQNRDAESGSNGQPRAAKDDAKRNQSGEAAADYHWKWWGYRCAPFTLRKPQSRSDYQVLINPPISSWQTHTHHAGNLGFATEAAEVLV